MNSTTTRTELTLAERVAPRHDEFNVKHPQVGQAMPACEIVAGDLVINRDGSTTRVTQVDTSASTTYPPEPDHVRLHLGKSRWVTPRRRIVAVVCQTECGKCSGSGKHYSGGAIVNGVYTGGTSDCYGCGGKGWCNRSDVRRNYWYHARYARI